MKNTVFPDSLMCNRVTLPDSGGEAGRMDGAGVTFHLKLSSNPVLMTLEKHRRVTLFWDTMKNSNIPQALPNPISLSHGLKTQKLHKAVIWLHYVSPSFLTGDPALSCWQALSDALPTLHYSTSEYARRAFGRDVASACWTAQLHLCRSFAIVIWHIFIISYMSISSFPIKQEKLGSHFLGTACVSTFLVSFPKKCWMLRDAKLGSSFSGWKLRFSTSGTQLGSLKYSCNIDIIVWNL